VQLDRLARVVVVVAAWCVVEVDVDVDADDSAGGPVLHAANTSATAAAATTTVQPTR
jgi:hypothetical protein